MQLYLPLPHKAHDAINVPKIPEPHNSHELMRSIRMCDASPLNGMIVAPGPDPVCRKVELLTMMKVP